MLPVVVTMSACATTQDLGGDGDHKPPTFPPNDPSAPKGSITGKVFTPAGAKGDPVYNALVFVPKGTVGPFKPGVACERCGSIAEATALVSTLTAPDGSFRLDDVPSGTDVPLVVQVGRWRRQVKIPKVEGNVVTELPIDLTRLPRDQSEGDLPLVAISTAYIDPYECVLKKMGVAMSEFHNTTGRVHFYQTFGETGSKGAVLAEGTRPATELWSNLEEMKKYDMMILPCEAREALKTAEQTQNLIDYANAGGRVFTTHYGYVWIQKAQDPFPGSATWHPDDPMGGFPSQVSGHVDTSTPKGTALGNWIDSFELSQKGIVPLFESRYNVESVTPNVSQRWIYTTEPTSTVQAFTFNTPAGAADQQCGRVVYTNFHVSVQREGALAGAQFPTECDDKDLTAQERVLEFLLLDLASCVMPDTGTPTPPK